MRTATLLQCLGGLALLVGACTAAAVQAPTPLASTPVPVQPTPAFTVPSSLAIFAHRGGAAIAPENSMTAFNLSGARGYNLELDVHLSKDGVVMVIHDPTVERTSNGARAGRVSDFTQSELQRIHVAPPSSHTTPFTPIPTLAEVLAYLAGTTTVRAEVEIKVPPWGRYVDIEAKVVQELVARSLLERVQVSSFDFETLRTLKRVHPQVKTVALLSGDFFRRAPVDQPAKILTEVQAVGATVIAVDKSYLTRAIVDEAHQRGVSVEVWTVDSAAEMKRFSALGVDGIITNQPDVLQQLTR